MWTSHRWVGHRVPIRPPIQDVYKRQLDGMEHLLFRSAVLLWNLQCFTGFNFLVTAGVHFNDVTGSDIIHAGYGIKTCLLYTSNESQCGKDASYRRFLR